MNTTTGAGGTSPAAAPDAAPTEERSGFLGWWDRLGRGQRVVFGVIAVLAAIGIGLNALSSLVGGTPGGPASSSFSTGDDGLRAWSELLQRDGRSVDRYRGVVRRRPLRPDETVVVVDPRRIGAADAQRYRRFVEDGGRLVLVGSSATSLLGAVTGSDPSGVRSTADVQTWVPTPEVSGVQEVAAGFERWTDVGPLLAVAGSRTDEAFVVVADVGRGRVVGVADATPFQNAHLARADDAALALDVVGPRDRPVAFVESTPAATVSGLDAVPTSWKWAAGLGALAFVIGLWSAGSRFGAPEPDVRALRPARREHVDAVAADLARVVRTDAETVEPLVASSRLALAAAVGAPVDASPAVLWSAGEAVGFDPSALAVLTHPVEDLPHALQVGAVAAARQRVSHGIATAPGEPTRPAAAGSTDLPALTDRDPSTHPTGGTSP